MASSLQYSSDLRLPVLPDLRDLTPEVYNEFLLLYNALKLTAANLDNNTGFVNRNADESRQLEGNFSISPMANVNRANFVFAESAVFGTAMGINASGQLVRAINGQSSLTAPIARVICVEQSVEAGQVGEVVLYGAVKLPYDIPPRVNGRVNPAVPGQIIFGVGARACCRSLINNGIIFYGEPNND